MFSLSKSDSANLASQGENFFFSRYFIVLSINLQLYFTGRILLKDEV